MDNSILHLYLKRVADGDKSYLKRLCRKIADEMVYVPVEKETERPGEKEVVCIEVPCIGKARQKNSIPVFTSRERLAAWSKTLGHAPRYISLLCGDLCLAMDDSSSVHINPESEYSVELASRYKQIIVDSLS